MAKRLRHRIEEIERRLPELKLRPRPGLRRDARYHAISVAAIALSGQPRIDEPLHDAWARTLQHHGISVKEPWSWDDQVVAARQLSSIIMDGADESAQFTQIFKSAPVWLLQFTGTAVDARFLKFQLPDLSSDFNWGSTGYADAVRWPRLPLGRMADGKPIPTLDARRLWIILFCEITEPAFPDRFPYDVDFSQEEERSSDPLLDDIIFALELDGVPEEELSRHQKRRLRNIAERLSRL
jgi:hypothetical protein